jgi:hypothetical protein
MGTCTAAWCSLLWALAAEKKLRWSSTANRCSTASKQDYGSASKDVADSPLAILNR